MGYRRDWCVEVDLQRGIRSRRDDAIPPDERIPARVDVVQSDGRGYRGLQGQGGECELSGIACVRFSFGGEGILRGERGIGAESAVNQTPVVLAVDPGEGGQAVVVKALRISAKGSQVAGLAPITNRLRSCTDVAEASGNIAALRVIGLAGDDVDDAVYCIRSPYSGARSTNHFNSLDAIEGDILRIPEDAGEDGVVHRATVKQDEQLIGVQPVEAASG